MQALEVVKHLQVIEEIGTSILSGEIDLSAHAFALEQRKEAIGQRTQRALEQGRDRRPKGAPAPQGYLGHPNPPSNRSSDS